MLAALIQRYDIKNVYIYIQFKTKGLTEIFTGCQVPHFMIVLIPYINLLNLSSIIKLSIFEDIFVTFRVLFCTPSPF